MKRTGIDYYFICLLGVIAALVTFKWQYLGLPYFWDEAWVYAPAVLEMHKSGLSLLPDAIPPELSRGHPLLFHFLATLWVSIFGTSFFAIHSFPLLISVALLIAVYFFCKDFFSPLVGLLSALMLAVQPIFIAQSSFLLPEVMMALWTILSLYFYLKEKWILYIVFASLMLLTKESGVVLIGAIGFWNFTQTVFLKRKNIFDIAVIKTWLIIAFPLVIAGIYFLIQKLQYGWFFYPEHIGMLTFNWEVFHEKFLNIYSFLLQGQGRYFLLVSFFVCASFFWKELKPFDKIFIPSAYLLATFVLFNLWNLDDKITLVIILIIFARLFETVFIRIYNKDERIGAALCVSALFAFLYFIFCQLNFLSLRYLLLIIPIIIMVVLGFIHTILENRKWLFILIALISVANCLRQINKYETVGDYNLSYIDAIKAQKKFVNYCEQNNWYSSKIFAGFNSKISLNETVQGYRNTDGRFTSVTDSLTNDVEFCVFTNIEPRADYDSLLNEINLEHLISFEENKVWIDVYKFKGFTNDSTSNLPVSKRILSKI